MTPLTLWPAPSRFFISQCSKQMFQHFVVILLNQPISWPLKYTAKLWNQATFVLCADGGANRLYDHVPSDQRHEFIPDIICGDLDSIFPNVLQHYTKKGSVVIKSGDQDSTDLQKCIQAIYAMENIISQSTSNLNVSKWDVLVLNGLDGRIDHTLATMHVILQEATQKSTLSAPGHWRNALETFLLSRPSKEHEAAPEGIERKWMCLTPYSFVALLRPGVHILQSDDSNCPQNIEGETCGLIPLGIKPANVVTKGLRWDLDGTRPLEFGKFISSSNQILKQFSNVHITTNRPIFWIRDVTFRN